jgi:hypothetical protein
VSYKERKDLENEKKEVVKRGREREKKERERQ